MSRPPRSLSVAALAVGALFLGPIAYLVIRARSLDASLLDELGDGDVMAAFGRTVLLASTVSVGAVLLGSWLAWLVARSDVPLRRLWAVLAPLPLVYPSFVGAAAILAAFDRGGLVEDLIGGRVTLPRLEGFWAAWLVLTLFTYPYVYLPVVARLRSLPPSLEESARMLGRSTPSVVRTVVLPQAAPAISAGGLLVFLYALSDFGVVEILRYSTLTREIYATRVFDQSRSVAMMLLLGLFALVVVTAERWANRRSITPATDTGRALTIPLGRWRWAAFASVVLVVGNALVGPLISLLWWIYRGARADGLDEIGRLLGEVGGPAAGSAWVATVAAVVAVGAVLPVAWLTARHRNTAGAFSNAAVVGGFALPGLATALALGYWSRGLPALYQTFPLLIAAYVIHFGAQAVRAAHVAVGAVPTGLDEAARTLGAGRLRRLRTVELPLMLPGLLAGGGLVLLSVLKELPATLLLSPIGFETLSTRIWAAREDAFFAEMGVASVVLVALSAALTWVLVLRTGRRSVL